MKRHFPFFAREQQAFPRYEPDFTVLGKGFDLVFPTQSRRVVGLRLPENQRYRPVGRGVFASLARIVNFDAFLHILGDAGVKGAIGAFSDI